MTYLPCDHYNADTGICSELSHACVLSELDQHICNLYAPKLSAMPANIVTLINWLEDSPIPVDKAGCPLRFGNVATGCGDCIINKNHGRDCSLFDGLLKARKVLRAKYGEDVIASLELGETP